MDVTPRFVGEETLLVDRLSNGELTGVIGLNKTALQCQHGPTKQAYSCHQHQHCTGIKKFIIHHLMQKKEGTASVHPDNSFLGY